MIGDLVERVHTAGLALPDKVSLRVSDWKKEETCAFGEEELRVQITETLYGRTLWEEESSEHVPSFLFSTMSASPLRYGANQTNTIKKHPLTKTKRKVESQRKDCKFLYGVDSVRYNGKRPQLMLINPAVLDDIRNVSRQDCEWTKNCPHTLFGLRFSSFNRAVLAYMEAIGRPQKKVCAYRYLVAQKLPSPTGKGRQKVDGEEEL